MRHTSEEKESGEKGLYIVVYFRVEGLAYNVEHAYDSSSQRANFWRKKEASDRTGSLRIQGLGFQSSKVGSTWDMQGMHYDV